MNVSGYIKQLQSFEEHAFSWDEILRNCDAPESTLRKELTRLAKRNEIINLRQGFYVIIPPRYQNFGKLSQLRCNRTTATTSSIFFLFTEIL